MYGIFSRSTIGATVRATDERDVTVEDVENLFLEGWRLGLKALAIYRDNCKVGQPLSADRKVTTDTGAVIELDQAPVRRRLPKQRPSRTTSFRVGDIEGYLTAGSYPDDGLGEIFVKVSKQGSTLSGVMDAFAIAVSVGLQYGVPLEALVAKFTNMIFEPNGMTDDKDIRIAQSLVDYLARRLAIDYLDVETRHALGIKTAAERTAEVNGTAEAPAPRAEDTAGAAAQAGADPDRAGAGGGPPGPGGPPRAPQVVVPRCNGLAPISRHGGRSAAMARAVGPERVQHTIAASGSSDAARRAAWPSGQMRSGSPIPPAGGCSGSTPGSNRLSRS
jgi:ribonucleoside-diphosphate reductase alpha chain